MLVAGVAYIAIALLTLLSRSVRDLPGCGADPEHRQHHFSASALTTVRLRLVATPSSFSTWTLVSLASEP